jgi:hypothetical protein
MTPSYAIPAEMDHQVSRWQVPALIVGIVLLAISGIGAIFRPGDFFRSYLMSFLFWTGLAVGSLAVVMLQHLTGGAWGVVTRRPLESASRTLPVLVLLFIPMLAGLPYLYDWARPDVVRQTQVLQHRAPYMNAPMFILRTAAYFVIWGALAFFLNRWSIQEDQDSSHFKRLARLSAPGLILYVFTVTFASIDWAESLETHWFSTMWGFLFVASQGITVMSFVILCLVLLARREPMASVITPKHLHDLGKLLLMFVMLWAYFAFSQLLIVWSGNLTDEIPFYLPRLGTTWGWVGGALIVFQFIVPFVLLLSRDLKRSPAALSVVVLLLIFMRWVDLFWVVMPSAHPGGVYFSWLDVSVPLAFTGIWISVFLGRLKKYPLLPLGAPNLEQALNHGRS